MRDITGHSDPYHLKGFGRPKEYERWADSLDEAYCFAYPGLSLGMDDRERDLPDAATELSETLEALRAELREPARGPLGLPRPPSPSELLQFTEQYTIPTVIALLETSIRALELLAAALRVADGRPLDAVTERPDRRSSADSLDAVGRAGHDRLARTSRETLRRLDDALADLQSAAAGEQPSNPETRRLLEEARELRAEVDERLTAAVSESNSEMAVDTGGRSEPVEIGIRAADDDGEEDIGIDVDEELASIKDDIDAERSADPENDDRDDNVTETGDESDDADV